MSPFEGNREAGRALEDAYKGGRLRAIGVSNFELEDLDGLLEACTVRRLVNQILAHVSNAPLDLFDNCQQRGVLASAQRSLPA